MTLAGKLKDFDNNYPDIVINEYHNEFNCSFIIPMFNTSDTIIDVLECIQNQTDIENIKEVILIDDQSEDQTVEKVQYFSEKSTLNIKILENKNKLYAGMSRNRGLDIAQGEIIFLLDSDLMIPPNYIHEHCRVHSQIDNGIALSFRSYISLASFKEKINKFPIREFVNEFRLYKKVPKEWFLQKGLQKPGKDQIIRLFEDTNDFRELSSTSRENFWTLPEVTLIGASSISRNKIAGNRFNKDFKGWGYEDIEFAARIIANDNYVIPVLNAGVYHIEHDKRLNSAEQDFERNYLLYIQKLESTLI